MSQNTYDMPDLQLRMSKKIAQLTNVIHHLHTKTEDHEMDLQEMAAAYESEIENMLKDAATRINSFKNQLEAARDDKRFQEAVQKVKAEHEQLRKASVAELAAFKQKMSDREIAVQKAAKRQMDDMDAQIQLLVKRLDVAVADLDAARRQADDENSNLTAQLAKAQEETKEAIKEGNHRYNAMLNARMNKEDHLRRSIENIKLEMAGKESMVKNLQQDLAAHEKDAAMSMARQQKEWEGERRAAALQQEQVERKWQDRLQAAVASAEEQRQHTLAANRKIGTVEGALASARDKHAAELSKSVDLGRQVEALRAEVKQAEFTKDGLEGTAAQERERVSALQDEVRRLTLAHAAAAAQVREAKDGLKSQVVNLTSELQVAQQEVKDLHESHRKAVQDHNKSQFAAQLTESELHDLRLAFADLKRTREREQKASAAALEDATVYHAAALRSSAKDLAAAQEQLSKERQERADAMQQGEKSVADVRAKLLLEMQHKVEAARQDHRTEVQALQAERTATASAVSAGHLAQVEELRKKHEAEMLQAQQQHVEELKSRLADEQGSGAAALAEQQAAWGTAEECLKMEVRELRVQLESLRADQQRKQQQSSQRTSQSEGERLQLQQRVSSLNTQLRGTEERLKAVLEHQQQAQEVARRAAAEAQEAAAAAAQESSTLQQTVRDLQAKHGREKHEADVRLEKELDQLRAEVALQWKQRMEASVADSLSNATRFHKDQLDSQQQKLSDSLQQEHDMSMGALRNRHNGDLSALKHQLETQNEKRVSELCGDWKAKLDTVSSEASMNMKSIQAAAADELAREKQAHASEIGQMQAQRKEQLQTVIQRHERELAEAKAGHEAAFKAMRKDLDRVVWEKDKLLAEQKLQSSQELKSAQAACETAARESQTLRARLEGQVSQLQAKVRDVEAENQRVASKVVELQGALVQKSASMTDTLAEMQEAHEGAMVAAAQSFTDTAAAKEQAYSRNVAALQRKVDLVMELQATLEDVRAAAEEKYDSLAQAYTELRAQWETRGPREEDVQQIRMLMSSLEGRDAKIAAFEERYNELHNEMLLREDNYNSRFANGGAGRHKLAVDKAMSSTQDISEWMLKRSSRAGAVNRTSSLGPRSSYKVSSARGSHNKPELGRTGPA